MAGSATCRISSEQTVMPSWAHASISETFSMARSVVWARLDPASARGSIWLRRADITANSAATKNALPTSSTASQSIPSPVAHAAPAFPAASMRPLDPACGSCSGGDGLKQMRSIRRPSIRVTLSFPPTTSTVSPTAAMRPSWLMT